MHRSPAPPQGRTAGGRAVCQARSGRRIALRGRARRYLIPCIAATPAPAAAGAARTADARAAAAAAGTAAAVQTAAAVYAWAGRCRHHLLPAPRHSPR